MSPGVIPFAGVVGLTAKDLDLSLTQAFSMTLGYFAGSSQMASLQLMGEGAILPVVLITAFLINLRFALYSAAIAPYVQDMPKRWRWPMMYLLSDQSFNLTMPYYLSGANKQHAHAFLYGVTITLIVVWMIAAMAGVLLGETIPSGWSLEFAIPLVFISIIVPVLCRKPLIAAALVAGSVTMLASSLPFNLSLVLGTVLGIFTGLVLDRRGRKRHE